MDTWRKRPYGYDGVTNMPDDLECRGTLPGIMNACCRHKEPGCAYVELPEGSDIRNKPTLDFVRESKGKEK